MAVTITQQPESYNLAYIPNIYTVQTSTGLASLEVIVNGSVIATFKQPHNPSGVAIFDIQSILQSLLQPHYVETTERVTQSNGEIVKYQARIGEVNSSGTIINTTTTAVKYAVNGYDDWRVFQWNYLPYRSEITEDFCEGLGIYGIFEKKSFLTNFPEDYKIRRDEYHTLSFVNELFNLSSASANTQPYFAVFTFYNAAGSGLYSHIYTIDETNGLGPRTGCNDIGPYTYTVGEEIGHIGVGVQNLKDAGIWLAPFNNTVAYYDVKIHGLNECLYEIEGPISDCEDQSLLFDFLGEVMYEARFYIDEPCTPFEPIRLSFMNQYGVRDYFTFDRRNTLTVGTDRNNYRQSLGSYSAATFSIDPYGRGARVFSSETTTQMSLSTYWMSDDVSKWLQELFQSPSVMIYHEDQWEPCVIVSNEYSQRTSARDQLFQHNIVVEFANKIKIQRG